MIPALENSAKQKFHSLDKKKNLDMIWRIELFVISPFCTMIVFKISDCTCENQALRAKQFVQYGPDTHQDSYVFSQ